MSRLLHPNPDVPQIPQPIADPRALAYFAQQLKQGVDSLSGHRGSGLNRAVTIADLVTLGIITNPTVDAAGTLTTDLALQESDVSTRVYLAKFWFSGVPAANQLIGFWRLPCAVTFPINFASPSEGVNSTAACAIAATASTTINVDHCKNGSDPTQSANWGTIGTITFAAGAYTGTLSTSGNVRQSNQYDYIRLIAPASPDLTFANFSAILAGSR